MTSKNKRVEALLIGAILCITAAVTVAYAQRIFSTPPSQDTQPITVIAVGDSNTFGAGVVNDDRKNNAYPAQLDVLLGNSYQVLNFGIGGATLLSNTGNSYRQQDLFPISLATNPDIVLIMLGTNDVRTSAWNVREYEAQLTAFVNTYKSLSSAPKIYILSPPAEEGTGKAYTRLKDEVVPAIKKVTERTNSTFIDVAKATDKQPELYTDGVHLTAKGYKIIAETVYAAIKPVQE